MVSKTFKYSFKATLPVMAGYLVLGIGFGMLMQANGYGSLWTLFSSMFIYAGSMQYVSVSLLSQASSILTAGLITLLVNLRHVFYGISMLEKYGTVKKHRAYLIFSLTDETFTLLCNPNVPSDIDREKFYFYVSILDQIWWITGSILGSLISQYIPFKTQGIEFSMTALFLVMFTEQWESSKNHEPALIGIGITVLCLLIFGSEQFLIPSMVLMTLALLLRKEKNND